ncbi:MAG: VOC family protein [Chloroflexota bacterium]
MSILLHVGVRATDLERSIRFWRDGLGLQVTNQRADRYDLSDGYHNFAVFQHNGDPRPSHVSGVLDYLHIGVGVADATNAARKLREMGYEIFSDGLSGKQPLDPDNLQEPAFKVEDPDGITVDVAEVDRQWPGTTLHPSAQ